MGYDNVLYERDDDGVVVLTVNRPAVMNALDRKTLSELHRAFLDFRHDQRARVLILTGAGEKAFVAGADIAYMSGIDQEEAEDFARLGQNLTIAIESVPKAVIAAVNGYALGGGCELAMACDFILASDNARFGQPEVNLGLIPGFGGTQRLARIVGRAVAKQMIYTGEIIKAARALDIGLANAVYPQAELLSGARGIARTIASKGPLAVGAAKRALNRGYDLALEVGLEFESMLFGSMFKTDDMREGTKAFLDKRDARFTGR
ncbi:MAG: enoyl-CoA hydratase/isomerase family protein [Myxococcales bacterium]|nr:enoyl-CoA hydratase/isomerase family protein [Myxococcales bacterium]MCB9733483.1 enoyl-CoA hydratase/isomerase family protein [Deltaproteobacteria bacterium]